jgi:hypothetical protein
MLRVFYPIRLAVSIEFDGFPLNLFSRDPHSKRGQRKPKLLRTYAINNKLLSLRDMRFEPFEELFCYRVVVVQVIAAGIDREPIVAPNAPLVIAIRIGLFVVKPPSSMQKLN